MSINIHIYPSNFRTHSNLRQTTSLAACGLWDAVHVIGIDQPSLPELQPLGPRQVLWRVPRPIYRKFSAVPRVRGLVHDLEWHGRVYFRYRRADVGVVQCNSLSALPVGVALKHAVRGARLVYAPYELETETQWLTGWRKRRAKWLERVLIRHAEAVVLVSDSIARWYLEQYPFLRRVRVVRNIPVRPPTVPEAHPKFRERLGVRPNDILFIYQGSLTPSRGIDFLLDVFSRLSTSKHIVFMGDGPSVDTVRFRAVHHTNIHYHPIVPPGDVLCHTAAANVGLHFIENTCLNHYYCLPNKIFEYLLAGLPIMVRDYPEMGALVDRYQCGQKVAGGLNDVVALVDRVTQDDIHAWREGALRAWGALSWQQEQETLLSLYDELMCDSRSARSLSRASSD